MSVAFVKPFRLFIIVLMFIAPRSAHADDWTVGVGGNPARNGYSAEFGPFSANRVWESGLSAIIAQQAVIEGQVVAMARIQNLSDVLYGTVIVAHDLFTGDTLWTAGLPVSFPSTDWRNRVSGIRDGKVYATRAGNTNASFLYALDAATGEILWESEDLITESSTEGVTYAEDGDPISTGQSSVIRINSEDGTTVWETSRSCPTSGGCDPVVHGSRVYLWEAGVSGPVITAFDLGTGARLFSSDGIGGGFIQQVAPFVGPDGIVYAPRTQNNPTTDFLVAFQDTGQGFMELWRVPLGYVPFASFGIDPDGSVYSYSRSYRVIKINQAGEITDSSMVIESDFYQPRMAVDSVGQVFVTNGGFSQGAIFSFSAWSLSNLQWSESITNVNVGGPALGQLGHLIVCGVGTDVRAYRTDPPLAVDEPISLPVRTRLSRNYPNPFNAISNFELRIPEMNQVSLKVYDLLGREIATIVDERLSPGTHTRKWDASGQASGVYIYRLETHDLVETGSMVLLK